MSNFYKINNTILDISRITCVTKSKDNNDLIVSMGNINHIFNGKDADDIFNFLEKFCLNHYEEVFQEDIEFKDILDEIGKANYFQEDYENINPHAVNNVDRAIKRLQGNIVDFEVFYNIMKICKMDYQMNTIALWVNGKSQNVMTKEKNITELSSLTDAIKWWLKLGKLKPEKKVLSVKKFNPFEKTKNQSDEEFNIEVMF